MNAEHRERHHRRIRRKAKAAHWTLLPLAAAAPLLWLYFAVGRCQEAESAADAAACRWLSAAPLLPVVLGLAIGALLLFELVELGLEWHHHEHGLRPLRRRLRHARHGYHAMDRRHQRHVLRAALEIAVAVLGVCGWLLFEWYSTTH